MRTLRSRFLTTLALLTVASCQGADSPSAPHLEGVAPQSADLRSIIIGMGFRADMIVDRGSYYVVEGDIVFDKARLRAYAERPGQADQRVTNTSFRVDPDTVRTIRVSLQYTDAGWLTPARDAMAAWNAITWTKIRFVEHNDTSAHIDVAVSNTGECRGLAGFPEDGIPGKWDEAGVLSIFTGAASCSSATAKKWLVMHELGHTIGFRHTNYTTLDEPETEVGAVQVTGTPDSDASSIMHHEFVGHSSLSTYDAIAAQFLYPEGPLTASVTNQSGSPLISFGNISNGASFTIKRIGIHTYCNDYENLPCESWETELSTAGTTTSMTFVDTGCAYTGDSTYWIDTGPFYTRRWDYYYDIEVSWGTKLLGIKRVDAPIAGCF